MQSGADNSAEPNLTPLLDLILQLVMFFMMCANFVMEQVNDTIILPKAQMARPMDKTDGVFLFLNIDEKGRLLVSGQQPKEGPAEIGPFIKREYEDARRKATPGPDGKVQMRTKVVIRAHEKVKYTHVWALMNACKQAGFRDIQLRAKIVSRDGTGG